MRKSESKSEPRVGVDREKERTEEIERMRGDEKERDHGGRENGTERALETELCVLLNAEHKLPVFCFRETMRELIQSARWAGVAERRPFPPRLARWTSLLYSFPEHSSIPDARPLFRRRTHKPHFSCDRGAFSEVILFLH